ncbi:hypothetical protein [Microtetraspora malaysiensis]|uniref:Uncharacterized protein n=1 Tax=Microtetraspora malaysiensis TaxID=161358 RepID=A0ABW6T351_9ACTN
MPNLKLDSKLLKSVQRVLEPHGARMGQLGSSMVAIVEFTTTKRVDVVDDETEPVRYLQITGLEVATREQEDALRNAQQAMFQLRTAHGTLEEIYSTEDAERKLRLLPGTILAGGEG